MSGCREQFLSNVSNPSRLAHSLLHRALKGQLSVPTLILWGEKDAALGTQASVGLGLGGESGVGMGGEGGAG